VCVACWACAASRFLAWAAWTLVNGLSTSLGWPPAALIPTKPPSSRHSTAVLAVNAIRLPFDQPATSACVSSASYPLSGSCTPPVSVWRVIVAANGFRT
jgi:hypothetical protein